MMLYVPMETWEQGMKRNRVEESQVGGLLLQQVSRGEGQVRSLCLFICGDLASTRTEKARVAQTSSNNGGERLQRGQQEQKTHSYGEHFRSRLLQSDSNRMCIAHAPPSLTKPTATICVLISILFRPTFRTNLFALLVRKFGITSCPI